VLASAVLSTIDPERVEPMVDDAPLAPRRSTSYVTAFTPIQLIVTEVGEVAVATRPAGGAVHFVPGFPVMAWPMIEALLDTRYAPLHGQGRLAEQSVIVPGAMEATLTPLMQAVEAAHPSVRVFSLPSVDHPVYGRHIELGVKGAPPAVPDAYRMLRSGLAQLGIATGPELVR